MPKKITTPNTDDIPEATEEWFKKAKVKKFKPSPKKPARLIRFVGPETLPVGMAAQYDATNNLVRINKELYDTLLIHEKAELMFTNGDIVFGHH